MKKVVKTFQQQEVGLQSVQAHKFYGVKNSMDKKGFIILIDKKYRPRLLERTDEEQHGWPHYDRSSLKECIRAIIENEFMNVYEFETEKALLEWMLK